MAKNFDGVQFAYFQYFHYNFTGNAFRRVERNEATDKFRSTVVFLLNELFVTTDDIRRYS